MLYMHFHPCLQEPNLHKHLTQEELTQTLNDFAQKYPSITRLYSLGKTAKGRDLWVMEITDQPGVHEPGILIKHS